MSTAKRRGAGEGSVRERSDGRWEGSYEVGWSDEGKRLRRSVYAPTRQALVAKLRDAIARAEKGLPAPDERLTTAKYLTTWLEGLDLRRLRPSTAKRYRGLLEQHAIPALQGVKLARLTPQRIEALMAVKLAAGLAPRTVWHLRAVLRTALADAVRSGELVRNPASLARPPKADSYHVEPMTPDQARAILAAVAGTDIEAPVSLALWTGLRQGEVLALRWEDVDLAARRLTVRSTLQRRDRAWFIEETKTEKSKRTVPLPAPAVDVLATHRERQRERRLAARRWAITFGDLVFTDAAGNPVMGTTLTHQFRDTLQGAGLRSVRFHDLRHGAATLMLAAGIDLKVVSELLGHSTIATTANVYAGVLDTLKTDAADRLARLVRRPG